MTTREHNEATISTELKSWLAMIRSDGVMTIGRENQGRVPQHIAKALEKGGFVTIGGMSSQGRMVYPR